MANPTRTHDTLRNKRKSLQEPQECDTIAMYLTHGNGGRDVNVRVPNSGGGSPETEGISRYCFEAYQEEKTCGLQNQRSMAYRSRRSAKVSELSEECSTRIGKLIFAFSVATQLASIDWTRFDANCYKLLLRVHCTLHSKVSQWHGVADGEELSYE